MTEQMTKLTNKEAVKMILRHLRIIREEQVKMNTFATTMGRHDSIKNKSLREHTKWTVEKMGMVIFNLDILYERLSETTQKEEVEE